MFLFLNSLGTGEVFFILLIVLLLFGSKSIPSMAKGLGRGIREIQNASNEIKRDIQNSVLDIKKEVNLSKNMIDDNSIKDQKKEASELKVKEVKNEESKPEA